MVLAVAHPWASERKKENRQPKGGMGGRYTATPWASLVESRGTWSTWSAIINRTCGAGELRSAPSGPDDWHRVTG